MKKLLIFFFCFQISVAIAQSKYPALDKSPMDMCYYPDGYPLLKIQDKITEPLVARLIYGRPQKNGRVIFGELVEYGKVWRLGANEATEIEFFKPVKIGGTKIKKGRYTLYCIPNTDKWTIILNKETDTWGAFKYNTTKDIIRYNATIQRQAEVVETLSVVFEKSSTGANLLFAWDDVQVVLPISF